MRPWAGHLDPTREGTGLHFAILFGIASPAQAQSIMQKAHVQPYGVRPSSQVSRRSAEPLPRFRAAHCGVIAHSITGA
jgi:hypothetical protein